MTLLLNAIDERAPDVATQARRWGVSRKTYYQWKHKWQEEIGRLHTLKGNTQGDTEVTQNSPDDVKKSDQGNTGGDTWVTHSPSPNGSFSPTPPFSPLPQPKLPSQKDTLTSIQKGFPRQQKADMESAPGGFPTPESVVLDEPLLAYCAEKAPDIDPHDFLDTFINQCHAKPYGYKDHRRAFQNWIKQEQRRHAEKGISPTERRNAFDEPLANYQRIRDAARTAFDP